MFRSIGVAALFVSLVITLEGSSMQDRRVVTNGGPIYGPYSPAVVAGGLVYVSALRGVDEEGQIAGPDVTAQTRRTLERLKQVLEAAGSSLPQTVNVNVCLKSANDFDAMNAAYREFFSDKPPARTTVVGDLPSGVLVEMSAVAVPNGAAREVMHPSGWAKTPRPYSSIVRAGEFVYFAGLVSRRGSDDQMVSGPVRVQTKTILDNAAALLRTAGLTYDNVVAARVFITDDLFFEEMNDEYGKYFRTDPPARATVVAGLMGTDAKVEISLVASTEKKQVIGPQLYPTLPVSTAVRAGRHVFVSGVLGNTDENRDDLSAQTRETLARIAQALAKADVSFADVVDSTIYVTDVWQLAKVDDVYRLFFPSDPPARMVMGTRLVARTGLVEIMMTAVK